MRRKLFLFFFFRNPFYPVSVSAALSCAGRSARRQRSDTLVLQNDSCSVSVHDSVRSLSFHRLFQPARTPGSARLQPVFQTTDACLFCILTGFFCGFPMGARVCAQSLQQKKISRREASWLLAFINNIGPVYFSGYVLTLFPVRTPLTVWLGMYLLPFLYGMVLRYTLYRDLPTQSVSRVFIPASVRSQANTPASPTGTPLSSARLLSALHESILSAMNGIAQLGGYMVFFNLLNLFPTVFWQLIRHLYARCPRCSRSPTGCLCFCHRSGSGRISCCRLAGCAASRRLQAAFTKPGCR